MKLQEITEILAPVSMSPFTVVLPTVTLNVFWNNSFFSRATLGISALFVSCGTDVESVSHSPTLLPVSGCSEAVVVHEESAAWGMLPSSCSTTSPVLPALSSLFASLLVLCRKSAFWFFFRGFDLCCWLCLTVVTFWPATFALCWLVPRFCLPVPETTFTSLTGFLSYCGGAERQTLLKWDILPHWWQRLPSAGHCCPPWHALPHLPQGPIRWNWKRGV